MVVLRPGRAEAVVQGRDRSPRLACLQWRSFEIFEQGRLSRAGLAAVATPSILIDVLRKLGVGDGKMRKRHSCSPIQPEPSKEVRMGARRR